MGHASDVAAGSGETLDNAQPDGSSHIQTIGYEAAICAAFTSSVAVTMRSTPYCTSSRAAAGKAARSPA